MVWLLFAVSMTWLVKYFLNNYDQKFQTSLGLRTLCSIFLRLVYSHYFHYCAPVDFYYACNYSHFSHKHAPEIFHTCKFSHSRMKHIQKEIHDTAKHKIWMLKVVTVYEHQRVLMVVATIESGIAAITMHHKFTTTRAVNSFPYYSMGTSLPSIIPTFPALFPRNSCSWIPLLCRKLCSHNGLKPNTTHMLNTLYLHHR